MKKFLIFLGVIGMFGFFGVYTFAVSPQPPTIDSITPSSGPVAGGTSVTITGTHLDHTTVTIGGSSATNVVIASNNQSLTATTPAGTLGGQDVVVTKGTDSATLTGGFMYLGDLTIVASADAHGSITPSGSTTVSYGSDQSFTITPNTGYHIADVAVDGSSTGATSTYLFSHVTTNHTIAATFAVDTHTLSYTAGAHGSIVGSSTQIVDYGSSGTQVNALSGLGFQFVDWSDGSTTSLRTDTNVTADISVTANFKDSEAPVITLLGSPTVNLIIGDTYTDAGATALDNLDGDLTGSIVTTTTPGPVDTSATSTYVIHYNVSDAAGNPATEVTRTVNVTETPIVTHTITVSSGANGSISPLGPSVLVNDGSDQTFTITPDTGYRVTDVIVDGTSTGATTTYTFTNVTGDHTISATFDLRSLNAPVITLNGSNPWVIALNTVGVVDPMATAIDAEDGDISASVLADRSIDTSAVGTYYITYSVTDSDHNTSSTTRQVSITEQLGGAGGTSGTPVCKDPRATNYDPSGMFSGGTCYYPTPQVLGVATTTQPQGEVLGVSTTTVPSETLPLSCSEYLKLNLGLTKKALRQGANNDPAMVVLLQRFLNEQLGIQIPITGYFGSLTTTAVKEFQLLHADGILAPWGLSKPTGIVYVTTVAHINNIKCPSISSVVNPQDLVPAGK